MLKKKLGINAIERRWWSDENLTNHFKIPSTLIIPEDCREIGGCAFWDCERLEKVVIPGSVEVIKYNAFWYCRKLREVIIPENVEEIEEGAFKGCSSLEEVIIPKSVKFIDYEAFYNCLNAVIILRKPESEFEYINSSAFWECKDVKEEVRN